MKERIGRTMDRMFDRLRHPAAFELSHDTAVHGSFDGLRGRKYAVLVTLRRDGEAVPSPVWVAVDADGRAFVRTMRASGKVKRIRNDPRALLAPATLRGRPLGVPVRAIARELPEEEWGHAEATLAAAYGAGRKVYEGIVGDPDGLATYIELVPDAAA